MINKYSSQLMSGLKTYKVVLFGVLFAAILANLIVVWHVLTEKTVYYWDYSYYWTSAIDLAHSFNSTPGVWDKLVVSLSTDYNYTPILLVALVMHFFGDSRLVYELAILNLYVLPVVIIAVYLFREVVKTRLNKNSFTVVALSSIVLLPSVLIPVLEGLPDIFGLLPVVLFLFVMYHTKAFSRFDIKILLLGLLLFLILVSRRWYVFWVIGAAAGLSVAVLFTLLRNNKWKINRVLFASMKWPAVNGVLTLSVTVSLLAVLTPYVLEAYRTDYGDMYDAYKIGGKVDSVNSAILYFGLATLVSSTAGYAASFFNRKIKTLMPISIFFIVSSATTFIFFIKIQGFTPHHYYLLVPAIIYGLLLALHSLLAIKRINTKVAAAVLILFFTSLAMYAFVVPIQKSKPLQYVLGQTWRPTMRGDIGTLQSIVEDVRTDGSQNATLYVVGSSHVFNSEIIANVNQPHEPRNEKVLEAASIDKRDGFPNKFFSADYVVVTNPVQVHLPTGQKVVTVLNDAVLAGRAKNLKRVKTYTIDNNIEAVLYKRTAPYSQDFIEYLRHNFEESYSGYPHLTDIKAINK